MGPPARVEFLGAPLDLVSMADAVALAEDSILTRRTRHHAGVGSAFIARLRRDPDLAHALASFDLVTADGQGVVWGARLLTRPVPERVTGIDLMQALLARADAHGWAVYLLGAEIDVVATTVDVIAGRYPRIRVVGWQHGYFDRAREDEVVRAIASSDADLLFVGLSTPEKELFLHRHRAHLDVRFAMGVGGTFDIMAGRRTRAPRIMQRAGLEWAWRVAQEPRRMARYVVSGHARYLALLAREVARTRVRR
jgi:N-acetylglucosaminyldiphosphoundecaprenol N-acetyl-beta-D-mannosaminyltransferase